jgi:hypothetical protein
MSSIEIKYNGSNIGPVDQYIIEKYYNEDKILFKIDLIYKEQIITLSVHKYKNDIPLILDDMKIHFGLCKTHFNICNIENEDYLIYKNCNEISILEYKNHNINNKKYYIKDIRNIFVFYWLMNVKNYSLSLDNYIYVRSLNFSEIENVKDSDLVCFHSIYDKGYNLLENSMTHDVPNSIIKEWFDDSVELFYEYVGKMIKSIDCEKFRQVFTKIIKKYKNNNDYISWVNITYSKLLNSKIYT